MEKGHEWITVDGNEAVASVAYRLNEVIAVYPITPASAMGELADDWSTHSRENIWGDVPDVIEMQSEGGAAGAVHGSLQAGALTTTFTASQGLLLMIPNMYKIAGELTPFVLHVAARTVATHALSIFCDHSDVMTCRETGFAILASGSVQEAQDFACIAQAVTLAARIPFLHCFDGFRTSHEIQRIAALSDDELHGMIDDALVRAHRGRALTPDNPVVRGTAQNPDVFFQAREASNAYYDACAGSVKEAMERFGRLTGRTYDLVEYVGHAEAERVIVMMGSGAEAAHETVDYLNEQGEKVGLVKLRLYRPFPVAALVGALPKTVRQLGVLDRTKEPGAIGEPLYLDVVAALAEGGQEADWAAGKAPAVSGGRYGLSSKEFNPAMVKSVFDALADPAARRHFTVGINDDLTKLSLPVDASFQLPRSKVSTAMFYGLGADGTVGANKNSIKIITSETGAFGQGYFVYDSKKSGAATISHLRFGPTPIRSSYLIGEADFVACHQFGLLSRFDVLANAAEGATVLLNAPGSDVWDTLPLDMQATIIGKRMQLFVIDAAAIAEENGLGRRINTIMQTCFFALTDIIPLERAKAQIKAAIKKTYGRKSEDIVGRNFGAVDMAIDRMREVAVPKSASSNIERPLPVPANANDFVQRVTGTMIAGKGDQLPVSVFAADGTWPVGTSKFEKRNIAAEIPVWDEAICIQCNKCAMVCPHAAIRVKVVNDNDIDGAPSTFKSTKYRGHEFDRGTYVLQVAPEDCTGCTLCYEVCPARDKGNPRHKALEMEPHRDLVATERENFAFFLDLPELKRPDVPLNTKQVQFLEPLFEFSGACSGCGETPYIKLMTQLFGDRMVIANATGCSSIYGGNLPTTPYTTNKDGHGPAWANSLFEDNAEFGLGMRLAVDHQSRMAERLLKSMAGEVGDALAQSILTADQSNEAGLHEQRQHLALLSEQLAKLETDDARRLEALSDYLLRKSVWIVGGDGWAYDIGYGGVDHVLGMGRDVNILVLDTEVYSNTGGQQSKATPLGAAAKFAMAGRSRGKKDLGLEAMAHEQVYVARIAMGAKDAHTVRAFLEAESYPGPSLIIAYSPCIAHGYDLAHGLTQQKLAVDVGHWPLYRYDPRRIETGEHPFQLDSAPPRKPLAAFTSQEARYRIVQHQQPERYAELLAAAEATNKRRFEFYQYLAGYHSTVQQKPAELPEAAD